jgi:hypothetical protein
VNPWEKVEPCEPENYRGGYFVFSTVGNDPNIEGFAIQIEQVKTTINKLISKGATEIDLKLVNSLKENQISIIITATNEPTRPSP